MSAWLWVDERDGFGKKTSSLAGTEGRIFPTHGGRWKWTANTLSNKRHAQGEVESELKAMEAVEAWCRANAPRRRR